VTGALSRALHEVPAEIFTRADALAQEQDAKGLLLREGRLPCPAEVLTRLIAALKATPSCRALVYGTGTGYPTALLAPLVREVCAIEGLPLLMTMAERTLGAMGLTNVRLRAGEATAFQDQAPFDLILVPYGVSEIPGALKQQLAPGGRLVAYVPWDRAVVRLKRWALRLGARMGPLAEGQAPGHLRTFDRARLRRLFEPVAREVRIRLDPLSLGYYVEALL